MMLPDHFSSALSNYLQEYTAEDSVVVSIVTLNIINNNEVKVRIRMSSLHCLSKINFRFTYTMVSWFPYD